MNGRAFSKACVPLETRGRAGPEGPALLAKARTRLVRGRTIVVHALLDYSAAGAAPGSPDQHRHEQTDGANNHQNHADGLNAHTRQSRVDGEGEDRADSDEENADADAHVWLTP